MREVTFTKHLASSPITNKSVFGSCMKLCTYGLGEPDDVILVSLANMKNVAPSSMTNLFDNHTFSTKDQSTSRTPNVPKSDTFEHIPSKHNSRVTRSYMLWVPIFNVMPMLVSFHIIHESSYLCHGDYKNWTLTIDYLPLDGYKNIYQCYSKTTIVVDPNLTSWSNHVIPIFVITPFMVFSVMY